jgi:hypothetical protein
MRDNSEELAESIGGGSSLRVTSTVAAARVCLVRIWSGIRALSVLRLCRLRLRLSHGATRQAFHTTRPVG